MNKIFSFVKINEDSIVASSRIATFIGHRLGVSICWDASIAEKDLDTLIIVNGAYAFAGNALLSELGYAIENAKRVIWVQNDYTIIPPKEVGRAESPFRKAFRTRKEKGMRTVDYWTTVLDLSWPGSMSKSGHNCGLGSIYVNWNALAFNPNFKRKTFEERALPDSILYYGSFRKGREQYFDRYFDQPAISTVISSPSKKFGKYTDHRINLKRKLEDLYTIAGEFGLGLYLEDKKSHREYHSPANRFYEMLSVGLPIVFQPECDTMMKKAGYDIAGFIAGRAVDVVTHMMYAEEIGEKQQKLWRATASREYLDLECKVSRMLSDY